MEEYCLELQQKELAKMCFDMDAELTHQAEDSSAIGQLVERLLTVLVDNVVVVAAVDAMETAKIFAIHKRL
jgi:hypothetical protein